MAKKLILLAMLLCVCFCSCKKEAEKKSEEQQTMSLSERDLAGVHLGNMLNDRDFERALQYIDSVNVAYPNDPQFYFVKGWVYDMMEDSLNARVAYSKSIDIYDSLIAAKPNEGDMINRAMIVQILYGKDAYIQALDEMESVLADKVDKGWIRSMKEVVFDKNKLSFAKFYDESEKEEMSSKSVD